MDCDFWPVLKVPQVYIFPVLTLIVYISKMETHTNAQTHLYKYIYIHDGLKPQLLIHV